MRAKNKGVGGGTRRTFLLRRLRWLLLVVIAVCMPRPLCAQIDPYPRELIELGYHKELNGHAPLAGYLYYYRNVPQFLQSNLALRAVVSPVYADGELGIRDVLGPHTDIGIGLAGGGFAYSYNDIRGGTWFKKESWVGHGVGVSGSVYHLFNPAARIPLYGVFRSAFQYAIYESGSDTARNFVIPDNQPDVSLRAGLRWGGLEFVMMPALALEVSGWYDGLFRLSPGTYGFAHDRDIERWVHLFWGRALIRYTMPESKHTFGLGLDAGTTIHPDQLSAYRLGGLLDLTAEFPYRIPGYYVGELSARNFFLLNGFYDVPLDSRKCWRIAVGASTGRVSFTPGMDQPHNWNSGVGCQLSYCTPSESIKIGLLYGYGINAIRDHGEGGHAIALMAQIDLEKSRVGKGTQPRRPPFQFFKGLLRLP